MKHLIRLTDIDVDTVYKIFEIADELPQGKYKDALKGKTVVMFFPNTSIRTRVTFEKGIYLLGGQSILFPSETLDKKEEKISQKTTFCLLGKKEILVLRGKRHPKCWDFRWSNVVQRDMR